MNGNPNYDKELCMYVSGNFLQDVSPRARIVDGVAMMPVRAIGEAMGLKVTYDPKYDSVVCSVGSDQVILTQTVHIQRFSETIHTHLTQRFISRVLYLFL